MKIISIEMENKSSGWKIEKINFNSNLTLLVGLSGVGKTQILNSINCLKDIARGLPANGLNWKVNFCSSSKEDLTWEGAFSVVEDNSDIANIIEIKKDTDDYDEYKPVILFEKFYKEEELIIDRTEQKTLFNDKEMPKLSSNKSMVYLLREEESIKDTVDFFRKISFKDNTKQNIATDISSKHLNVLKDKYKTIEEIKNSNENVRVKLFLCFELDLDIISNIKTSFINIFPQVEDIKIRVIALHIEMIQYHIVTISIKEKDSPKWIDENTMSSGMLRTLLHISEILLSKDGSVILIDEFENSLGINCIDTLTEDLIHENKNLQFIATSHHPYIINNIPYEYWKIVTRKGGNIKTHDAKEYGIGNSKQQAFIQLIKLLEEGNN
ncbi:MAG: hypothetical protein RLZZ210_304 [Pseudomonadota bacterium]|jgi:energy-coupling factor transporter ATP-binding protein EcfA2